MASKDKPLPLVEDPGPQVIRAVFERQGPTALALRTSKAPERIDKLVRLRDALLVRREAWYAAFEADLGKPPLEVD